MVFGKQEEETVLAISRFSGVFLLIMYIQLLIFQVSESEPVFNTNNSRLTGACSNAMRNGITSTPLYGAVTTSSSCGLEAYIPTVVCSSGARVVSFFFFVSTEMYDDVCLPWEMDVHTNSLRHPRSTIGRIAGTKQEPKKNACSRRIIGVYVVYR